MHNTKKQKVLIIAPRHYVAELKEIYRNTTADVSYYQEELIFKIGLDEFIKSSLGRYDAFIGLIDFSSLLASYLNNIKGNPAPKAVVLATLQDKYLSRQIQHKIGLYKMPYGDSTALRNLDDSQLPVFAKPRRASMSFLAQTVDDIDKIEQICSNENKIRLKILNKEWENLYQILDLPKKIQNSLDQFIYESLLPHGVQVTLDGYVQDGKVAFFGYTKSVFQNNHISFKRFDFPYNFSKSIDFKIKSHAKKLISGSNFDNSLFNIEYKVDLSAEEIALVEINTRPSSQFMYPIKLVTGVHPLDIAIQIVLGVPVTDSVSRNNANSCSICVFRRKEDAIVTKLPDEEMVRKSLRSIDVDIIRWNVYASKGERLSDHPNDSHTYRYTEVIILHKTTEPVHDYEDAVECVFQNNFTFKNVE